MTPPSIRNPSGIHDDDDDGPMTMGSERRDSRFDLICSVHPSVLFVLSVLSVGESHFTTQYGLKRCQVRGYDSEAQQRLTALSGS